MDFVTFALVIKDLCVLYEGSEISGTRSLSHNAQVNGHLNSLHLVGLARDVVFDTAKGALNATARARQLGLSYKFNGDTTVHFQAWAPLHSGGSHDGNEKV